MINILGGSTNCVRSVVNEKRFIPKVLLSFLLKISITCHRDQILFTSYDRSSKEGPFKREKAEIQPIIYLYAEKKAFNQQSI